MKYRSYTYEDFIKDEYFQKWVLNPDPMTDNFWENWIALHPEKKKTIDKSARFIRLIQKNNEQEVLSDMDFDNMWQFIVENRDTPIVKSTSLTSKKSISLKYILKIAAIFIGLVSIPFGVYKLEMFKTVEITTVVDESRITLELQDGTIKYLDDVSSESITNKSGSEVANHKNNKLTYNDKEQTTSETLVYNQLTVPYGKKIELTLSDGTQVFLNSGTKLRYPVTFLKDKPRNVFLDGEAYFSVAKDKSRLFTVITDDLNTQVYGTEFNVSSYKNENNTSTVLVEGSVGVYSSNNNKGEKPLYITPGNRAVLINGNINVDKVDIQKYTAWKEGKLLFINDRFDVIIKELERHFNVKINNQFHQLDEKEFTGTFKEETIHEILTVFNAHSPFHFTINENLITISQTQ